MSCDGPSSTGLFQGSSTSSDPVQVGVEQAQFSGRKTEKELLPDNKKKLFVPSDFVESGYRQGLKDATTGLVIRDIIKCEKTSKLSNVLGDSSLDQITNDIIARKKHCDQALEKLRDYRDRLLEQVNQKSNTIDQKKTATGKLSSHNKSNNKKRNLEADADSALATSMHTSQQREQKPDQQHPTTSEIGVKHSHQGATPIKKRRVPTERTMDWPQIIDELVGDIQDKMNQLRDAKGGFPKDIQPCWYALTSGCYGDAVRELLMIVGEDERPSKAKLNQLQQRMINAKLIELPKGEESTAISEQQSKDLHTYLKSRIFNGKLVSFHFNDFNIFLKNLSSDRGKFDIPTRLLWLGDEIRGGVYRAFFEKGIRLNSLECWRHLSESRFRKAIIDLMSVISLEDPKCLEKLQDLQKRLNHSLEQTLPFVFSGFDSKDEKITKKQAEDLHRYLRGICFKYEYVDIDFDKLRKYLASFDENEANDNEDLWRGAL